MIQPSGSASGGTPLREAGRDERPRIGMTSVEEMLAVAAAMESEAAERYATLADCMRRLNQLRIAELLDGLAAEERGHVESVRRLAQRMLHRDTDRAPDRGLLPRTFAREDEASAAALLSPYRTLSIAVRHEERAFGFWTYAAAQCDSREMRELAESFARQELLHAAKLRQARRRAFHAERVVGRAIGEDMEPASPAGIRAEAARREATLAAFCMAAEQQLRSAGDLATADLLRSLGDEAQRTAAGLAPKIPDLADDLDRQTAVQRSRVHGVNGAALLFETEGMVEDLDYRYLEWLDRTSEQGSVQELETLAQSAATRLARINGRLRALEPTVAAITGMEWPE